MVLIVNRTVILNCTVFTLGNSRGMATGDGKEVWHRSGEEINVQQT
jgi:hypothetical protein